jgi:hypothetical protein
MQRPTRFTGSALIAAPILSAAALVSGLAAQQLSTPPRPALQCYVIWPDTGSRPRFLPVHLVLGANPIGGIGFRAAAVFPTRMYQRGGDDEDTLYTKWSSYGARWRPYGRLFDADSIYIDWFIPGSVFGPIGELYARVYGDSLSGRVVQGGDVIPRVVPWLPIHGRSEPCLRDT